MKSQEIPTRFSVARNFSALAYVDQVRVRPYSFQGKECAWLQWTMVSPPKGVCSISLRFRKGNDYFLTRIRKPTNSFYIQRHRSKRRKTVMTFGGNRHPGSLGNLQLGISTVILALLLLQIPTALINAQGTGKVGSILVPFMAT